MSVAKKGSWNPSCDMDNIGKTMRYVDFTSWSQLFGVALKYFSSSRTTIKSLLVLFSFWKHRLQHNCHWICNNSEVHLILLRHLCIGVRYWAYQTTPIRKIQIHTLQVSLSQADVCPWIRPSFCPSVRVLQHFLIAWVLRKRKPRSAVSCSVLLTSPVLDC